ncbi:MAG: putative lipid II flippase FtsW [Proteobacteria bacterium]|nr:putative lipid II flippase FtsW [Pseudomonadota bacterium]|tara:strand:+ start:1948 stop:3135 length:1188 start_codon:yes stop_codon:yes gene_type:complete
MRETLKQSKLQRIIFGEFYRDLKFSDFDLGIFVSVTFLSLLGIIMVTSVTIPLTDGSLSMAFNHIFKLVLGAFVGLIVFRFSLEIWKTIDIGLILFSFFLLILVFIPFVGFEANGASRWIRFFGFSFQPSELMKFALIVYISSYCYRRMTEFKEKWLGFWKPVLVVVLAIALVLFEPDLGSSAVIFLISLTIMFIAGAPLKQMSIILFMGLMVFVSMIILVPWRMQRILSFVDPWSAYGESGYQLSQALIAFSRGDLFGVGLGESLQKYHYLPDAQTDFIFAIIAEELGLIFCVLLISIYGYLIFKSFSLGRNSRMLNKFFESYISYGIGVCIAFHVFINVGVSSGMLPTKGLTLPFISFGGTNLMLMFALIALLFRINLELKESSKIEGKVMSG